MTVETRTKHMLVDPVAKPKVPGFTPAPRLRDLTDRRVGLIDDSKENAKELLEEMVGLLRERYGVASVKYHRKPSASKIADPAVIQELSKECDFVIVAVGS